MNYATFATNFPEEFREAFGDISMHKIGCLLDSGDHAEIGKLIWSNINAALESAEDIEYSGASGCEAEYKEEARLDERDRAREYNRG